MEAEVEEEAGAEEVVGEAGEEEAGVGEVAEEAGVVVEEGEEEEAADVEDGEEVIEAGEDTEDGEAAGEEVVWVGGLDGGTILCIITISQLFTTILPILATVLVHTNRLLTLVSRKKMQPR